LEGYLKWAKALNIIFYVGLILNAAFLIYIIYSKTFSNLLPFGMFVILSIWCKPLSKKMEETYYKNPDAEIIDVFELQYKSKQEEKKLRQEYKAQKKNKQNKL